MIQRLSRVNANQTLGCFISCNPGLGISSKPGSSHRQAGMGVVGYPWRLQQKRKKRAMMPSERGMGGGEDLGDSLSFSIRENQVTIVRRSRGRRPRGRSRARSRARYPRFRPLQRLGSTCNRRIYLVHPELSRCKADMNQEPDSFLWRRPNRNYPGLPCWSAPRLTTRGIGHQDPLRHKHSRHGEQRRSVVRKGYPGD